MNPDWYDDPTGLPFQRYWDGVGWTESTRPTPPGPWTGLNVTAPLPQFPPPPPVEQQKWFQRKGVLIPAGIVSVLIVLGVIGSLMQSPKKNPDAGPAAQVQSEPFESPSAAPASHAPPTRSETPSAAPRTPTSKPMKKKDRAAGPGSFAMPDEVGQILQDAQDDIQRVSGDPVFFSHSHDLLGDRFQILDRDWQVCTQNVVVGSSVSAIGHIDFGVVKTYEDCP